VDLPDLVSGAGSAGIIIASIGYAVRQWSESRAVVEVAKAKLVDAQAKKLAAEADQARAGAEAFKDALERVDRLEARVGELEQALERSEEEGRHLQGQVSVLGQELEVERRARAAAEGREHALARELTQLRLDIHGGHTQLPTPLRPGPPKEKP
jgi:chromosome segregation ATPase